MDKLNNNKSFLILKYLFILATFVFIIYATVTCRGIYEDGAMIILEQLNNLSHNVYQHHIGYCEHPRYIIGYITIIPVWISNIIGFSGKKTILMVYSFNLFFLPALILYWNYRISQRTNRIDIFFWHLFTYCLMLLTFSIFACVEIYIGAGLHFIIWNYLASEIQIKKRDLAGILFCLVCMYATYEYVVFLGIIIFLAHFRYVLKSTSLKNQCYKTFIGFASLGASLYNIYYMMNVSGESGEINRFFKECYDFMPFIFNLCSLFSIITIILLLIFVWKKTQINVITTIALSFIYALAFYRLLTIPTESIYPMWEQHFRSIPCWALPLIFIIMSLYDILKKEINYIRFTNLICIVLLCGITQTIWQMINTYYWNKNIEYMKKEMENCKELLYVPAQHEEISSFHNQSLRRYIWHGVYTPTALLFSDDYEQKTLLMVYDVQLDEGNVLKRDALFVRHDNSGVMSMTFDSIVDIKNKYWDLTNCAKALDEYNKKNHIKTKE